MDPRLPDIVVYDVETTMTVEHGKVPRIIEFAAVILDGRRLHEKEAFGTLLHSDDISPLSIEHNGITAEMLSDAPKFADVADRVYAMLNGKIWMGHNISSFDNTILASAFVEIGRQPPLPMRILDTCNWIKNGLGNRSLSD